MIYDLDAGRPERPTRSGGVRTTAFSVVAGVLTIVVFAVLAFWPTERERQTPVFAPLPQVTLARPSFVTRPVPDRRLTLPPELAAVTYRITYQGQTGLVSNDTLATIYRLSATGDLVTVAPLPLAESWPYPSPASGDAPLIVRGRDANWIVTDSGTRAIRWVENGVAFEMSSRTLSVAQLADLASKLR